MRVNTMYYGTRATRKRAALRFWSAIAGVAAAAAALIWYTVEVIGHAQ